MVRKNFSIYDIELKWKKITFIYDCDWLDKVMFEGDTYVWDDLPKISRLKDYALIMSSHKSYHRLLKTKTKERIEKKLIEFYNL